MLFKYATVGFKLFSTLKVKSFGCFAICSTRNPMLFKYATVGFKLFSTLQVNSPGCFEICIKELWFL